MQLLVGGGPSAGARSGPYDTLLLSLKQASIVRQGAKRILTNPSTSCLYVVWEKPSVCTANSYCDTMYLHNLYPNNVTFVQL